MMKRMEMYGNGSSRNKAPDVEVTYHHMEKELCYRQGAASDLKQLKELGIASYGQYATVLTIE
jgi:hypothetical protein